MRLSVAAVCDRGCVREHNEDMVLVGEELLRDGKLEIVVNLVQGQRPFICAVADGMGGHHAGEAASEIALTMLLGSVESIEAGLAPGELAERFRGRAQETHARLLEEGRADPTRKGMGTTLVGVLFYEGRAFYMNAGDSRLYRFRGGNLMQVSRDHSLREVTRDPDAPSNVIVNSLGGSERMFLDFDPAGSRFLDGDALLLCSDGLTGMLPDDDIEKMIAGGASAQVLADSAKTRGGEDNLSVILVRVEQADVSCAADTTKEDTRCQSL